MTATVPDVGSSEAASEPAAGAKTPLYWRALALRHLRPNGWQRALLVEGVFALAAVLVLADLASAWTLLLIPLAVAAAVKANDLVAGLVTSRRTAQGDGNGADP